MTAKISELETLRKELITYVPNCQQRKSQPAKEILFVTFAERVFKIKPEEFSEKMETPVTSKLWLVKGRIDAVFGNLIIEFKVDLEKELDDALDELKKYFQALKEKHPKSNYLGIATDGVKFRVFKPVFKKDMVQKIEQIDSIDLEKEQLHPEKIYLWFDSYLYMSEKISPTTDDLRKRFGVESPTFAFLRDELTRMLETALGDPTVKTKIDNWEKYLEIVYGDKLTNQDLFIKHTYLATLAKIIVYLHLYQGRIPSRNEMTSVLDGKFFRDFGITNFIEEDFFAWVLNPRISSQIAEIFWKLLGQLVVYDLKQISEDVFKELYQQLVDPELRHDLGEYYTPDWLAEYAISDLISQNPSSSILDPACGSGTFLFTAVRLVTEHLKSKGWNRRKILTHILDNVAGVDIHPLAVIISRTNYLLALRDLMSERGGELSIPVYLGDSIRLPDFVSEVQYNLPVYRINATGNSFFAIPESLARKPSLVDEIIGKMYEHAKIYETGGQSREDAGKAFSNAVASTKGIASKEAKIFELNFRVLLDLIDSKSNSIWSFILRNIYKPVTLNQRKFRLVVGNPPWLTMRFMRNPEYREFLAKESMKYGLVEAGKTHQLPNMELATLFFREACTLYLEDEGTIAFVMPKSVLVSQQHRNFRKWQNPAIEPVKILDLEGVNPLFNVPACVVKARKLK